MSILSKIKNKLQGSKQKQEAFKGMLGQIPITHTKPEDIFIIGFPKSGNTWMQHIVSHLYYHLNSNQSRALVNLITPDVYANKAYHRLNDVCFFKSHDLPKERYRNVIYIMRDGRDALLSYYHMQKNMGNNESLEDYFRGKATISPCAWHEHVTAWRNNPFRANIFFVKYEDLKEKNFETIKKIALFINAPDSSDEFIKYVTSQTTFNNMKALETRDDFWRKNKQDANFKEGSFFVRKGKQGGYKNEVSKELLNEFNKYSRKVLLSEGYE